MDVIASTLLTTVHLETFSGVMVAPTGAPICLALIKLRRWICGHITGDLYVPGLFDISKQFGIAPPTPPR